MNEQEMILCSFIQAFSDRKEERIVLYGIGINTQYLLQHLSGWRIIGLMDAQNEGKEYWGLRVLRPEEVAELADFIVIIARPAVLGIIYSRISHLENRLSIYQYQGIPLSQIFSQSCKSGKNVPFLHDSFSSFQKAIDAYHTISFDLFDTLIMRKLPRPCDVFDLVEERIRRERGSEFCSNFRKLRIEAERLANQEETAPGVDEIYQYLCLLAKIEPFEAEYLKQIEWETEEAQLCLRESVYKLFKYALAKKKTVIILSDMYWGAKKLEPLLNQLGLIGYTELIVSSDYRATKIDGSLFLFVKSRYKGNILHIGDNEEADIHKAKECGIAAMQVLSSYELCLSSSLKRLLVHVYSLDDRIYLGNFLARFVNSPWALNRQRGRLDITTPEQFAEIFFFPIVHSFLNWMLQIIRGQTKKSAVLLFTARDGYLLQKLYEKKISSNPDGYPDGIYFLASRRAVTVANLHVPADINTIIDQMVLVSTYGEILFRFFGICADADDIKANTFVNTATDRDNLRKWLHRYDEKILKNAAKERTGYMSYIRNLNIGNRAVYIFDLTVTGTVPTGIERLLGRECNLICFSTWGIPNRYYSNQDRVHSFLGNHNHYDMTLFFLRVYKLFEILFSPQEGCFMGFGTQGPRFGEDKPSIESSSYIQRMQKKLLNSSSHAVCNIQIADTFLSLLDSGCSVIDRKIQAAFCLEDDSRGEPYHEIWNELLGADRAQADKAGG